MANALDDILRQLGQGLLQPATLSMQRLVNGEATQLDLSLVQEMTNLTERMKIVTALPSSQVAARTAFVEQFLDVHGKLKTAWRKSKLPSPVIVAPVSQLPDPKDVPDYTEQLEAGLPYSPFRKLAWLERALVVSRAVCKIATSETVGTGFLLRNGRIVTNNHVLSNSKKAENAQAIFNFQEEAHGVDPEANTTKYPLNAADFVTSPKNQLDCTVVGLLADRTELTQWGWLDLDPAVIQEGQTVSIIQHPYGGAKRISMLGNVVTTARTPNHILYQTSTEEGSSGAPVFNEFWKVVALHRAAGQRYNERKVYLNNEGVRFSAILANPELAARLQ